jgi:hypothetical protein
LSGLVSQVPQQHFGGWCVSLICILTGISLLVRKGGNGTKFSKGLKEVV